MRLTGPTPAELGVLASSRSSVSRTGRNSSATTRRTIASSSSISTPSGCAGSASPSRAMRSARSSHRPTGIPARSAAVAASSRSGPSTARLVELLRAGMRVTPLPYHPSVPPDAPKGRDRGEELEQPPDAAQAALEERGQAAGELSRASLDGFFSKPAKPAGGGGARAG